jgi:DNA polymerase-3 subunit gamma/tau
MSYTALYRKWRPQRFSEVVGQTNIVQALTNQLKSGRVGHAYLFCGTRGTGKTTIAKIMGRAVNCENPVNGEPCNECETCKAILAGASVNVVEIDAASNNGVDDIRQIREEVRYAPPQGHYRVYIIDEVHSLSQNAYNALLKTLEEPPSYVIFILATTEAHKIPVTVLSRCQRYDFKRIDTDYIFGHLVLLTSKEGIDAEEKALRYIARMADGGMRDALSLLEQCISCYYGEQITYEKVLSVLGAVDITVFSELTKAMIDIDAGKAIGVVGQMASSGRDLSVGTADYVWFLRNIMLTQTSDVTEEELGVSAEDLRKIRELADDMSLENTLRWIRVFSELQSQLKNSSSKRVLLEAAVIRAMRPDEDSDLQSVMMRLDRVERRLAGAPEGAIAVMTESEIQKTSAPGAETKEETVELPEEEFDELALLLDKWPDIVASCRQGIGVYVTDSDVDRENGRMMINLRSDFAVSMMKLDNHRKVLLEIIKKKTGHDYDIDFRLKNDKKVVHYKKGTNTAAKKPNWSDPIDSE